MNPASYLIDVRDLLEDLGATLQVDARVSVPDIVLGLDSYTPVGPAHLVGTLTNTGAGIVLDGTVNVVVTAVCSRCLEEFPLPVAGEVEGFYVSHGHEHDLPEEQEYALIGEGSVDVMDAVIAALALAMPFAPVHADDCPGICPQCGADLAVDPCECGPDLSSSPFAALADLLPGEEEGGETE
jgi:uncharacterized protein